MKKHSPLFLLLALFLNPAFAMKQTVQVCLDVTSHAADYTFQMGFISTDVFESWSKTHIITNGRDCVQRTYHHGPKSIRFMIHIRGSEWTRYYEVRLDDSCLRFSGDVFTGKFMTIPQRTGARHESWTFTITDDVADEHIYNMSCKRESS